MTPPRPLLILTRGGNFSNVCVHPLTLVWGLVPFYFGHVNNSLYNENTKNYFL